MRSVITQRFGKYLCLVHHSLMTEEVIFSEKLDILNPIARERPTASKRRESFISYAELAVSHCSQFLTKWHLISATFPGRVQRVPPNPLQILTISYFSIDFNTIPKPTASNLRTHNATSTHFNAIQCHFKFISLLFPEPLFNYSTLCIVFYKVVPFYRNILCCHMKHSDFSTNQC